MTSNKKTARFITWSAVIAAIYVVLTVVFAPISFNVGQIRIAEMLTILPLFTPAAIPGLFIGCILGNLLGGAIVLDIVFGSIATLIGAVGGYLLRKNRWLVPIPAVVSNGIIVPIILKYGYGLDMPLALMMLYVTAGEIIGCYILGEILASVLMKQDRIFKTED
ncbi:MAG: QueT transporter family protein [Oscillospiraceae bacterium]|nr:QueT transporter family protein [Oscillospiraceae bacterium]